MLAEPERTRYDLKFRLLRFPVRVHPWFWIMTLVLGAGALEENGVISLLAVIAVVFVSILVHELGHALAFRRFGADSHIVLHAFGGLTIPWAALRFRWQRIIVALAGPIAGFLLYGIIYGSNRIYPWAGGNEFVALLYFQLLFVNLWWGVLNLLPIWPLDGGQICEEVCTTFSPRRGREIALQISMALAAVIALYSLVCVVNKRQGGIEWIDQLPVAYQGTLWTAIVFGLLAYYSFQVLQRVKWTHSHWQ